MFHRPRRTVSCPPRGKETVKQPGPIPYRRNAGTTLPGPASGRRTATASRNAATIAGITEAVVTMTTMVATAPMTIVTMAMTVAVDGGGHRHARTGGTGRQCHALRWPRRLPATVVSAHKKQKTRPSQKKTLSVKTLIAIYYFLSETIYLSICAAARLASFDASRWAVI